MTNNDKIEYRTLAEQKSLFLLGFFHAPKQEEKHGSIRNIKQYLLTTLYNAPTTIGSYYSALVQHDLYGGGSRD